MTGIPFALEWVMSIRFIAPEKGKPFEKVGRKAIGLSPDKTRIGQQGYQAETVPHVLEFAMKSSRRYCFENSWHHIKVSLS
jgi:hypothetical protein